MDRTTFSEPGAYSPFWMPRKLNIFVRQWIGERRGNGRNCDSLAFCDLI
jgi:hypothetical protein